MPQRALVVVDVQNDFMPDGALPAAGGWNVVPVINELMDRFDLVVASQDWHPPNHGSFASNHEGKEPGDVVELGGLDQILWPDHCVQGTDGAEFVDGLHADRFEEVFQKGVDPEIDSYSAFYDNDHQRATGMEKYLKDRDVEEIYVAGVATDYCVNFTAQDGADEGGFETWVVLDACRGVEQAPGDVDAAIGTMRQKGAKMVDSGIVEARLT